MGQEENPVIHRHGTSVVLTRNKLGFSAGFQETIRPEKTSGEFLVNSRQLNRAVWN